MPSLLEPLRPKPFRGDVVAAGAVALVALVWVLQVRFEDVWPTGVHLACAALVWALITLMAWLSPMERDDPRAYQSVLYVSSFALATAVIVRLAEVAGTDVLRAAGAQAWGFAVLAALALAYAVARNSSVGTLLGAGSAGLSVLALADLLSGGLSVSAFRWVALGLLAVYALAAVSLRDRRFRHGVALVDAAGAAALAIALSFVPGLLLLALDDGAGEAGWGWELLVLACGFALIGYSSADREPGPAYLGVLNLIAFAAMSSGGVLSGGATLLGWPLALALAAVVLLAVGLRPTTPAPPRPDVDGPDPPPLPLR